jgi:hypothetical protein
MTKATQTESVRSEIIPGAVLTSAVLKGLAGGPSRLRCRPTGSACRRIRSLRAISQQICLGARSPE